MLKLTPYNELLQKLNLIPAFNWNITSIEAILVPVFQDLSSSFSCVSLNLKSDYHKDRGDYFFKKKKKKFTSATKLFFSYKIVLDV